MIKTKSTRMNQGGVLLLRLLTTQAILTAALTTPHPHLCVDICRHLDMPYEGLHVTCTNVTNRQLHCLTSLPNTTRHLELQNPKIDLERLTISPSAISLPHLRSLSFREGNLTDCTHLLDLLHNRTRESLVALDVSWNQLEEVQLGYLLYTAPQLQSLDLSENKLTSIQCGRFDAANSLQFLSLRRNRIKQIRNGSLSCLQNLNDLDLSYNVIGPSLHELDLVSFRFLKILNLRNNQIVSLSNKTFSSNIFLEKVSLSGNHLSTIPWHAFCHLHSLRHLALDNNRIGHITNGIGCVTSLWFLFLQNNNITEIGQDAFTQLYNLKGIWLNNNQLQSLPDSLRYVLSSINSRHVNLSANNMLCDCHLVWLVRLIQNMKARTLTERQLPTCAGPPGIAGLSLSHIKPEDMLCYKDCSRNMSDSLSCSACPAFSAPWRHQDDTRDACHCLPGYKTINSTLCEACPVGTFSTGHVSSTCSPCPVGSFTRLEASPYCQCTAGYTLQLGTTVCRPCPENTYKEHPGPGVCHVCPSFSMAPPGSTSPSSCVCQHGETPVPTLGTPVGHTSRCKPPTPPDVSHIQLGMWRSLWVYSWVVVLAVALILIGGILWMRRKPHHTKWPMINQEVPASCGLKTVEKMVAPHSVNELYDFYELPQKSLRLGPLVGQGAFGQVYQGTAIGLLPGNDKPLTVAVKCLKEKASREEEEALRAELDVMVCVGNHPNIIAFLGGYTEHGQLMLLMEYASHGNLLDYLHTRHNTDDTWRKDWDLSWLKQLLRFAHQVAEGMNHLVKMKCVHRDLAARNVLLAEGLIAKVSDFGLSRDVYEVGYYFNHSNGRLPYKWLSPESLESGRYTSWSDVWSYGILLWEMSTSGATPYPGMPAARLAELLTSGYRMRRPQGCPLKLYNIMLHCWHEEPTDRPTFEYLSEQMGELMQDSEEKALSGPEVEEERKHLLSEVIEDSSISNHYLQVFPMQE